MKQQEQKRQMNFQRKQAKLDHKLASMRRQEKIWDKKKKIGDIHRKVHPQPLPSQGGAPSLGLNLDVEFPYEKPRRRRE